MATVSDLPTSRGAAPRWVGGWRLVTPLGEGSFGTVWRAEDSAGRVAVVKLLDEVPGDEIRALSRVSHPAVVRLLDAGPVPVPYLTMSLAPGAPLDDLLSRFDRSAPASPDFGHHLVSVLASALAACHHAGVVHRDVKPENILYDVDSRRVTLVDFGLAGGTGGTPRYAAPEVLAGEAGGPAADVYGLALVAWEIVHGALPHDDLDWLGAIEARQRAVPTPTEGPGWWRDLLVAMLQPDPQARPDAAGVADVFAVNGYAAPPPTLDDLALRADAVHVPVLGLADATQGWLDGLGVLAVVGPDGSGKSHALLQISHELRARGISFVTMSPTGRPWTAVEMALSDPALQGGSEALPDGVDVISRARAAALALIRRCGGTLRVVVDDLEALDEGSHRTVQELARNGAALLIAAEEAPPWVDDVVELTPFTPEQGHELFRGLLGDVDAEVLEQRARLKVGTWPCDLVSFAMAVVEGNALQYRHGRWVVDNATLADVTVQSAGRGLGVPPDLPAASRRLGAAIAMLQPVPVRWALETAEVAADALVPLQEIGWVRGRRLLSCATLRIADALIDDLDEPRALWASVVRCLNEEEPRPSPLLGWALAGAEDRAGIAHLGAATIQAAKELDVRDAANLATRLHELCPSAELLQARIDACVSAGRVDEARAEGMAWLSDRQARPEDLPILVAMAKLDDAVTEDAEVVLEWTRRARSALDGRAAPAVLDHLEARALFRSGRLDEADALCTRLCGGQPPARDVADWLGGRGLLGQIRAKRTNASDGLAVLDVPDDLGQGTRARALFEAVRGRLLWMAGRPRQAAAVFQAAASQRESLSTVDQARIENNAALCWYVAGDVERAVSGWERALVSFEALGADLEMLRVQVNLCLGYSSLGRWDRAVEAGEHAVDLARERAVPAFEAVALGNLGDVAMWRRRFREAEALYDRADPLFDTTDGAARTEMARRRAELAAYRMLSQALELANHAVECATDHQVPNERGRSLAVRSLLHARERRRDEAYHDAEEALEILKGGDTGGDYAVARLWIAEAMLALQDVESARRYATEVLRFAEEFGRAPLRAWANDVIGWCRSRNSDDPRRLEQVTELSVRVARQIELGGVLDELAEAAVQLIDAERAFVVLVEGEELRVAARAGAGLDTARPSSSVVRRAVGLGREIVVTDLDERLDLQQAESVVAMELKAVMCAPLFLDGVVVGALYLDSRQTPMASLSDAVSLVRSLAAHASVALGNARLTAQVRSQVLRAREVAHDLRNPLAGVLMMLEDAADGIEPLSAADARRAVGDLRHALDMVHTSLSQQPPDPVSFPWQSAVVNWARSLEPQARAAGVHFTVRAERTEGRALGRPMELRRAVANVIGNAIKYTPPGAEVVVTTFVDDRRVGVWVDDEGPGIPEGSEDQIFQSGVQAHGALAGHGLGLAIARRICREHEGEITARRLPIGTRFELWVPRRSG